LTDGKLGYTIECALAHSDDEEEETKTSEYSITPEEAGK